MPLRNLLIIAIAAIISVACYSVSARNRYANIFAEALNVVEQRALQSMSREDLFDAAMNGLVSKLDRHSRYLHDDDLDDFRTSIDQQFGGIGVFLGRDGTPEKLSVRAAFPGSPADKAGLQAGDLIMAIDGVPLDEEKPGDAIKRMKGDVGQPVTVTVLRDEENLDVELVREVIDVPSVRGDRWLPDGSWQFTVEDEPTIGYVRIVSFGKETTEEFRSTLNRLNGDIEGLIIDLRGNSGGLLDCAIDLCDMLLKPGLDIVSIKTRNRQLKQKTYAARHDALLAPDIPIVVLIDRYSASASEIMAGCLQDHARATLIGEQTWGKGTVQDVLPIERGESALKLTTSSYWRPSGKNIDRDFAKADGDSKWGVQPDEGFEISQEDLEVQRTEFYRSEYELRELTDGMKFPKVFSERADEESEPQNNLQVVNPDSANGDGDGLPLSSPDQDDSVPTLEPIDPENYRDLPLERALEYLKSMRTQGQERLEPVAA